MRTLRTTAIGLALFANLPLSASAGDSPEGPSYPSGQLPGSTSSPIEPFGSQPQTPGQPGTVGADGQPVGPGTPGTTPVNDAGNAGGPAQLPADLGNFGSNTVADPFSGVGGGAAPGLGGFSSASGAPPGIIGDFPTITKAAIISGGTRFPTVPTPTPPPKVSGNPGIVNGNGTTSVLWKLAGLKVSDNQSPVPQDRFFYSFNYFDNLNASVDKKQLSPIQNLQVYHQLFGLEKTLFDGQASIGFRVPLNTISFKSTASAPGLGGSSTSAGDLSVFFKYILYRQQNFLFSTGLQLTMPTGPGSFGGSKYYSYFRDTQFQPFLGYLYQQDRFYFQGFTSINVPSTSQDVTLLFNDLSIGYYAYRANNPNNWLTAIVPTAEAHLTTPLNHRGFSATDLASTPDILDLTFGTNIELKRRAILSVAYVTPVTGPKPFNAEFVLLLNIRLGASRQNLSPIVPPLAR